MFIPVFFSCVVAMIFSSSQLCAQDNPREAQYNRDWAEVELYRKHAKLDLIMEKLMVMKVEGFERDYASKVYDLVLSYRDLALGLYQMGGELTFKNLSFTNNTSGSGAGIYLFSGTCSMTQVTSAGNNFAPGGGDTYVTRNAAMGLAFDPLTVLGVLVFGP